MSVGKLDRDSFPLKMSSEFSYTVRQKEPLGWCHKPLHSLDRGAGIPRGEVLGLQRKPIVELVLVSSPPAPQFLSAPCPVLISA